MAADAPWYEAASVVGVANALNVVADGLVAAGLPVVDADALGLSTLFADIRAFYGLAAHDPVPAPFALLARDPAYLTDVWQAVRHAFADNRLTRRHKTALAFAVSLTTRSAFGTRFHLGQMRHEGVSDRGVMEIIGVTQMFSSYTKIADTLQLESDMGDIAPVDATGVPGGPGGR
jgi:alkylhydroperoxidase/carboxymuconolactone decarboxylase family protein YurZ